MDNRISQLVVLGFSLLLVFGLGTGLFLNHTLGQRVQDVWQAEDLIGQTRFAVRAAMFDDMTRAQALASLLLDTTPSATVRRTRARVEDHARSAAAQLDQALASTHSLRLRQALLRLRPARTRAQQLETELLRLAVEDPVRARALYLHDYRPAHDFAMALATEALSLAQDEIDRLGRHAGRETARAQSLAQLAIIVFGVIGVFCALVLERLVTRLVSLSDRAAREDRSLIAHSLDIIGVVNAAGRFTRLNDACTRLWGYTPEELKGRHYIDFVHPDDIESTTRITDSLRTDALARVFQNRYIRKDGSVAYVQWSLRWSEEQQEIFAVAHDISESKRAEEALRASEERTRLIIATAHDAFVSVNEQGLITDWNPQAERIFGWSAAEAVGQPLDTLLVPERFRTDHQLALTECLIASDERPPAWRIERPLRHRDGHEVPVEYTVATVRLNGQCLCNLVLRDISDRLRAEAELKRARDAAEAASQAKSEFLANMSHEIRTPMNGVLGTIGLLLAGDLNAEQRELAHLARVSGEALLTILNDILDFAKIEAGKLVIEALSFDLLAAIEGVTSMLALQAAEKDLDIVVRYPPEVPHLVVGDPGRIRQVLTNLTSNALKFTEQGYILIDVGVEAQSEDAVTLRISVEDTGIGIAPGKLAALFEKFTQADASTTRRYGGTGLGLAISKQLVELMGGTIGAESREGEGSRFWFRLRLALQGQPPASLPAPKDLAGVRVLIVDDHAINRRVLREQLLAWNLRVEVCASGPEALKRLRAARAEADPVRIAILDYQMPDMDGEMLGRAIKADPVLRDTVLVMLTSLGPRGDIRRLLELGFAAYLVKPTRQAELLGTLVKVWSAHQHHQGQPLEAPPPARPERPRFEARVLLAEDNVINQLVASRILRSLGCVVDVAVHGGQAVEKAAAHRYDIVFMDCEMPEMDGFEATAAIRALADARSAGVPIVAVTAQAMQGDEARCLAAGMNGYLTKPVQAEAFVDALRRWAPDRELPPPPP